MKYLSSYKLFENVQKAKSILKSLDLDTNDDRYKKIAKILERNPGYIGDFTELVFKKGWEINTIDFIYQNWILPRENNLLFKKLSKKLTDYKNEEEILDELNKLRNEHLVKKILGEFPSEQRSLMNDWTNSIKNKLLYNLAIRKDKLNFLNKISRYKTSKGLYTALKGFVESKNIEGHDRILKEIRKSGARIVHNDESENLIIIEVDYKQLTWLCSHTSWCIKSEGTFYGYNRVDKQFVIYLTDKTGNESMIGVTIGLKFRTAHFINDQYVPEDELTKILKSRGYDINKLKASKEEYDKDMIKKELIENLMNMGYDLEQIIKVRGSKLTQRDFETIWKKTKLDFKDKINKLKSFNLKFNLNDRFWGDMDRTNRNIEDSDDLMTLLIREGFVDEIRWNHRWFYKKLGDSILPKLKWYGQNIEISDLDLYYKANPKEPKTWESIEKLVDLKAKYLNIITLVEFLEKEKIKYPDSNILLLLRDKITDSRLYGASETVAEFIRIRPDLYSELERIDLIRHLDSKDIKKIIDLGYLSKENPEIQSELKVLLHKTKIKEFKKFLDDVIPHVPISGRNSTRANEYAKKIDKYDPEFGFGVDAFLDDSIYGMIRGYGYRNLITYGSPLDNTILVMMFISLTKKDRLEEVKDMKLTYSDMGKIIRQAMWRKGSKFGYFYNGDPFLDEPFILNDKEEKKLFEFLTRNWDTTKLVNGTRNIIEDKEIERHKVFSLIYYKWGWGFDKYFNLIKDMKPLNRDIWTKVDGVDFVERERSRPEYFKHIFDYLMKKGKKQEVIELMSKILNEFKNLREYELRYFEYNLEHFLRNNFTNEELAEYIPGFVRWNSFPRDFIKFQLDKKKGKN